MFVLKNHSDPKLTEANFHARLCHLKTVAEQYSPNDVNIIFVH